ncbi:glycoside hydrolase, partial [Basidiobolus meristosporus CBS 931.73]
IAQVITNSFEHGTTTIEYGQCRDIGDGRGYTCGSIGFTTGTGDALIVVEDYEKSKGTNTSFSPFNAALERVSNRLDCGSANNDIVGLNGFDQAWKLESCDEKFRGAQDKLADTMYFLPAMGLAADVGVKSNLGKAIFY